MASVFSFAVYFCQGTSKLIFILIFNLLRLALCPLMLLSAKDVPWDTETNMYLLSVGWNILHMYIK